MDLSASLSARRWFVLVTAALSGIIVFISMVVDPVPNADGLDLIKGYSENSSAQALHTNLIHYGFAMTLPALLAMTLLVRKRGAWLANVAGLLALIGLTTLPGMVLIDFTSVAAANVVGADTAYEISKELDESIGFIVIVAPAFFASVLALPLASLAMWRGGLFPGWVAAVAWLNIIALNVIPEALIGFGISALIWLVIARALWKVPAETWFRSNAPASS
jgi:hypothetical protein